MMPATATSSAPANMMAKATTSSLRSEGSEDILDPVPSYTMDSRGERGRREWKIGAGVGGDKASGGQKKSVAQWATLADLRSAGYAYGWSSQVTTPTCGVRPRPGVVGGLVTLP